MTATAIPIPVRYHAAMSAGAECWRCPLMSASMGGPVPPTLPYDYHFMVVAEAPGVNEVESGKTLIGASGKEVRRALQDAGQDPETAAYTNAILCRPPGDLKKYLQQCKKAGKTSPIDACRPRLTAELGRARFALLMGAASLAAAGVAKAAVMTVRGTPIQTAAGVPAIATPHAAFVMRDDGARYRPVFRADIAKAVRLSRSGSTWSDPWYFVPKTAQEVANFLAVDRPRVAVDVETDGIDPWTCGMRRVGIGTDKEVMIYSPLSVKGHMLLSDEERVAQTRVIADYFRRAPRLDVHNGIAFDSVILHRHGAPLPDENTFDCYLDTETEFLTEDGWRSYDRIGDDIRLATFDDGGRIDFQLPTARVKKPRYGDMLVFEGLRTRAVVTPTHRMWCARKHRGSSRGTVKWDFTTADELVSEIPDQAVVRTAFDPSDRGDRLAGDFATCPLKGPYVEALIGLFVTDGNLMWNRNKRKVCITPAGIIITQATTGPAIPLLKKIAEHIPMKIYTYTRKDRAKTYQMWQIRNHELGEWALRACGRYSRYRRLPRGFLQLDVDRRIQLLDGILAGDSYKTGTSTTYSSASVRMRDEVHALALSVGRACVAGPSKRKIKALYLPKQVTQTATLFVRARDSKKRARKNCSVRRRRTTGHVVCFQVPNGRLVTRSRGKAAFHGNSQIGHQVGLTSELPHKLDFLGSMYTDAPFWKNTFKHSTVKDDGVLDKYLSYDIAVTHVSAGYVERNLISSNQVHVYSIDAELYRIGRAMAALGIYIDPAKRFAFAQEYQEKSDRLRAEFVATAGRDINPGSYPQIRKLLYEDLGLPILEEHITDSDEPSTDESTLLDLLAMGIDQRGVKVIHALLGYREAEKILGTNTGHVVDGRLEGGPPVHTDGRLRTSWRPGKTTGRWGSSDPVNLTNIPKKLRAQFIPYPGNAFVAADMQAVELRAIAILAGDTPLVTAFNAFDNKTGPDVHIANACGLFGCEAAQVTDEIRNFIKRFVYALSYGAEPPKIYQTLSLLRTDDLRPMFPQITLQSVERIYERYWKLHPAIPAWRKRGVYAWRAQRYMETAIHKRKRYFIGGESPTEMANFPIQGICADMQNDAVRAIVRAYPFDFTRHRGLVLNVHDQLVVECGIEEVEHVKAIVKQVMEKRIGEMAFPAEPKSGADWKSVS